MTTPSVLLAWDDATWAVALGVLVPALTVLTAWALRWLDARHKQKLEAKASTIQEHRDALVEYQKIVTRLERQAERLEQQITEQQKVIVRLHDLHAECREEGAEQRGQIVLLHTVASNLHDCLVRAKISVDPVPDLPPPRPRRPGQAEADFLLRQEQFNSLLGRNLQKREQQNHDHDQDARPAEETP